MPLGIRPTVDYVFKLLFGSLENSDLLIHLLNAVLQFDPPIEYADVLNPFNEKEFEDDKLSVVDIKARDSSGRWYVIEMQTSVPVGLRKRLVYYTSNLYCGQLCEGEGYSSLRPAISISFLTQTLFREAPTGHLRFVLHDPINRLTLGDQLQLHFIELSKYDFKVDLIRNASQFEQWLFFLSQADKYDAEALTQLLPDSPFQKATGVLEMISRSPEQRWLYDDQVKAELDRSSALQDARIEGEAVGEAKGVARGQLIGRIGLLQQLVGDTKFDETGISQLDLMELQDLAHQLEAQLDIFNQNQPVKKNEQDSNKEQE